MSQFILAIANQKGGVGKTATATALAAAFADGGARTLLVDADPQGSATGWLGFDMAAGRYVSLADLMQAAGRGEEPDPRTGIIALEERLHLLPAHINMAGLEMGLAGAVDRDWLVHDLLAEVAADYDAIVIDTPPTLGLLALNALLAASDVLIPQVPDAVSVQGLGLLVGTLAHLRRQKKKRGERLHLAGVVLTKVRARTDHHRQYRRFVADFCAENGVPFLSAADEEQRLENGWVEIPETIRAPDAAGRFIPLSRFPEAKEAATAYRRLAAHFTPTLEAPDA